MARELREEVTLFMEHQKTLLDATPRLPVFFAKGYNMLKLADDSESEDVVLEAFPTAIHLICHSEFRTDKVEFPEFPVKNEKGLLEEHRDHSIAELIDRYFDDITKYIMDHRRIRRSIPVAPTAVYLMNSFFQKVTEGKSEAELVRNLNEKLLAHLKVQIGRNWIPDDYLINQCLQINCLI